MECRVKRERSRMKIGKEREIGEGIELGKSMDLIPNAGVLCRHHVYNYIGEHGGMLNGLSSWYRLQSSRQAHLLMRVLRLVFLTFSRDRGAGIHLQTVAMGWPGGRRGKAEASTTRNPCTPITRALESTTAAVSFLLPMAQVVDGWKTVLRLWRIRWRISSSVFTLGPGKYSCPIRMGFMALVAKSCRTRLYPAIATAMSVGWVSQLGLMTGGSAASAEEISMVPRDSGATNASRMDAYWYPSVGASRSKLRW